MKDMSVEWVIVKRTMKVEVDLEVMCTMAELPTVKALPPKEFMTRATKEHTVTEFESLFEEGRWEEVPGSTTVKDFHED